MSAIPFPTMTRWRETFETERRLSFALVDEVAAALRQRTGSGDLAMGIRSMRLASVSLALACVYLTLDRWNDGGRLCIQTLDRFDASVPLPTCGVAWYDDLCVKFAQRKAASEWLTRYARRTSSRAGLGVA